MKKRNLLILTCILLSACATPVEYVWVKPGGTTEERDRCLAAAKVAAVQAYPEPMSQAQVYSESIGAPAMRRAYRNEIILNSMASQGWKSVPKTAP